MVDIKEVIPEIHIDMPYATKNNFGGRIFYESEDCFLISEVAEALRDAWREFKEDGYDIILMDCYRPKSVSMAMWEAGEKHNRDCREMGEECMSVNCDPSSPNCLWEPLTNYLSRTSIHNTGAAVDLTLEKDGNRLDMGTEYDCFGPEARTTRTTGDTLKNRLYLREVMQRHGFRNYYLEWWHYNHVSHGDYPRLDVSFTVLKNSIIKKEEVGTD